MAARDYSKQRIFWTKHAVIGALEDGFRTLEIEAGIKSLIEIPGSETGKIRGVIKIGERHCTLIFMRMNAGLRIITCWASSHSDINDYKRLSKK